jgi:hypothetical protein
VDRHHHPDALSLTENRRIPLEFNPFLWEFGKDPLEIDVLP